MSDLKQTPLIDFHKKLGARCVPFAGWEMPVSYAGIIEEHLAVRQACGFFDVCHMGEFVVSGAEAEKFLDEALTNRIAGTPTGKAVYSPLCAEDGGTIDDLIVYREGEEDFIVVVNASNIDKDFARFEELAPSYAVTLTNISDDTGLIAVQGPKATALVQSLAPELKLPGRFRHIQTALGEINCRICRTGYTGEDGVEIMCAAKDAVALAELLTATGEDFGAQWCGLGARDSLRLEAGYPLYGHELSAEISPVMAGLGWAVKLDKERFSGREPLAAQAADKALAGVKFFTLEGRRIAREGTPILDATDKEVGKVLSGTMSPVLSKPIGSALLEAGAQAPLRVELRGHRAELALAKPPLYK